MIRAKFAVPFLLTVTIASGARPATTIVMQFDEKYAPEAVGEMKQEAETVLQGSGLRFEWRFLNDVHPTDSFSEVILVRFKGHCQMCALSGSLSNGDALAQTHTVDGEVLPFTDVLCDKVRASVRSAMTGKDRGRGDYLMGRALGRILAHEIYHVVAKTQDHGRDGVTRKALSGADLISEHIGMDGEDLHKLQDKSASQPDDGLTEPESAPVAAGR